MSNNIAAIRDTIAAIAAKNGGLVTPENVIAQARNKSSALHACFTWDDTEAARLQRIHEARGVIRSVRVQTVVNNQVFKTIAYVRDPQCKNDEAGYRSTAELKTDADLSREVMLAEFGRAEAAMRRALDVAAALHMSDEVGAPLRAIQALKSRVEQMTLNA